MWGVDTRYIRKGLTLLRNRNFRLTSILAPLAGLLLASTNLHAQDNVPILSGALAYVNTTQGGATTFQPILAPVLVVPFGNHILVESRADIRGFFAPENGTSGPYQGQFFAALPFLQVDYIVNKHLTVSAGRFLTPFNIYNERLSPIWIANLQDAPVIFPIGTRTTASSNGGMVRGVAVAEPDWSLNYTAYFSALTTIENLQSGRAVGGRVGMFLPQIGVEFGASYQRFLQTGDYNAAGTYFTWQPPQIPLDVRAEYAHSPGGQGYWLEGALRFAKNRNATTRLSRLQGVARAQQFFKGQPTPQDFLPFTNVNQFDLGLNYFLPHDIRLNSSYGRQYISTGDANIWNIQITYRFLFPAWPGEHK